MILNHIKKCHFQTLYVVSPYVLSKYNDSLAYWWVKYHAKPLFIFKLYLIFIKITNYLLVNSIITKKKYMKSP
jgi:hypothetical protein